MRIGTPPPPGRDREIADRLDAGEGAAVLAGEYKLHVGRIRAIYQEVRGVGLSGHAPQPNIPAVYRHHPPRPGGLVQRFRSREWFDPNLDYIEQRDQDPWCYWVRKDGSAKRGYLTSECAMGYVQDGTWTCEEFIA